MLPCKLKFTVLFLVILVTSGYLVIINLVPLSWSRYSFGSSTDTETLSTNQTRSPLSNVKIVTPITVWNRPQDHPEYFKLRPQIVTSLDFEFSITSNVCQNRSPHLIILVLSMAEHRVHRDAIRETWGSVSGNNSWAGFSLSQTVRLVFLFGVTGNKTTDSILKREAEEKSDIVQADFRESYFNLTYKVLLGMKWVKQNCPETEFIMKNDEDSFVNIPWLLERLKLSEWNTKIIGPYFTNEKRFTYGKYMVNPRDYPFLIYPNHVKGNIYIMSAETAYAILYSAQYMPYVNMEDVHITGILARVIGAGHKAIPRKEYDAFGRIGACDISQRKKFAARNISPTFAMEIWSKVINRNLC